MQSARVRWKVSDGGGDLRLFTVEAIANLDLAKSVVSVIVNPLEQTEWTRWNGDINDHPFYWGNRSMLSVDPISFLWRIPGFDPWYLLTLRETDAYK
jgi:hypothetical protein